MPYMYPVLYGCPTEDSCADKGGGALCKEFVTKRKESTSSCDSVARDVL